MKKKRILGLALIGLATITCSSCIIRDTGLKGKTELTYEYTEAQWESIKANMTKFEEALNGNSTLALSNAWNEVNNGAYDLVTYRTIEYMNYAVDGNQESYNKYLQFQSKLVEIVKWLEAQYQPIYDSKWRETFYAGLSEKKIAKLLNSKRSDRFYDLEAENEALLKTYNDLDKIDVNAKAPAIYLDLVKNYKEQATEAHYNSYLEYAYDDIYTREYLPSDVDAFNENVKNYIVPMLKRSKEKVQEDKNTLTTSELESAQKLLTDYYKNNSTLLNDYSIFMGDEYARSYEKITTTGFIREGVGEKAIQGAFTTYLFSKEFNQPIIYFGPGYQNTFTFVHEFGHYNAFTINGAKEEMSYDLAETQSQGNEMVFLAWLQENNKFEAKSLEYIADNQIYEACSTIVLASIINKFESLVYDKVDLGIDDFDVLYKQAFNEFGGYEELMPLIYGDNYQTLGITDYWKRVCLENPGYYISYAMSAVPTLEIYSKCKADLSAGKQTYQACYKYDSNLTQADFLSVIGAAGLKSPFEEETYKSISTLV